MSDQRQIIQFWPLPPGTTLVNGTVVIDNHNIDPDAHPDRFVAKDALGVDPRDYGAVGDGTTDDTVAIQAAVNTGNKVLLSGGDYLVSGSIVFPGDMHMDFLGGAKIIAGPGTYSQGCVLYAEGSITQIPDLSTNAVKGQNTITLTSTSALTFDDLIVVFNPTASSWSAFRTYYHAGEFCRVDSVSGSTVALQSPLYDSYTSATADVYRVDPVRVQLNNPTIESTGAPLGLIKVEWGRDVKITNPRLTHKNDYCVTLNHCVDIEVSGGRSLNEGDGGNDYGLVFSNSQNGTIVGGYWYGRRHGVTSGGTADVGAVVCRDITYIGCRIANDVTSATYSADMHGNAEFMRFHRCHITGGITLEGANNTIEDCDIYGGQQNGPVLYAAEVLGGTYKIRNNRFHCFVDPYDSARGVIDFGGNSNAITADTTRDLTIEFVGNEITTTVLDSLGSLFYIFNRGSTKKINLDISDNTFNVNDFANAVWIRRISGTAASDFLIFDGNRCALNGRYAFYPDADYVNGLEVCRIQAHRWLETVTTPTTASYVFGTTEVFKWRFPRTPSVVASVQGVLYATGAIMGQARSTSVSSSSARLAYANETKDSGGSLNFPAAVNVTITAEAAIREV